MKLRLLLFALLCVIAGISVSYGQNRQAVEKYVNDHQADIVRELVSLLSIPNVSADKPNIRKNAELLKEMFAKRGFAAEILETSGNPLVYGELKIPGATRTVLFYAHYDGQPFNARLWKQESASVPIMREGRMEDGAKEIANFTAMPSLPATARIYARSASDDKAPIVALLAAMDALKSLGRQPSSNIRVVLDGEEEASSDGLIRSIPQYKDKFRADMLL